MSHHLARELDRLGGGDTWVHRLDARVKLTVALAFLIVLASFPILVVADLAPLALLPAVLLAGARVPARTLLRVLGGVLPLLLLVAVWNPILDRRPAAELGGMVVSAGMLSGTALVLRGLLAVAMVLALAASTPAPRLLRALRVIGAPRALVVQLFLLHRYLPMLAEEARRLADARRLRDPRHRLMPLAMAPILLATLLARCLDRARRIHLAMRARGFAGDLPLLAPGRLRAGDLAFGVLALLVCLSLRLWPAATWLGGRLA